MAQEAPVRTKIPTKFPQSARSRAARQAKSSRTAPGRMFAGGTGRAAIRGGGPVIELECGITVYPAREEQGRWRAVWHENGERQQCEAASEEKLVARLAKVTERLEADAPNMTLRGADLIAFYLSPDRLPAQRQWSRKHAHTQRRLCERFAAPVIDAVICQDITTRHMQQIVNAAPTPGEGARVRGMISALVTAGLEGGYLASARLAKVHGQAGDRALPPPRASVAGESMLWVDPAEVPAHAEQAVGANPLGLVFPSPTGKRWRSSNFNRNVLQRAYRAAGWRDAAGHGRWTWHSLRHVFCTTALFTWKLDATDVSRMAGHANYRITLDMYVGTTAGVLDRARTATQ